MAFDTLRRQFTREPFKYCEIEVDSTIYRFCQNRSPLPAGFDGIPSMRSQSTRPSQISLTGGIGIRASASVSFDEHQDYTTFGTLSAPRRFWVCWRAMNPGYQGSRLSIFSGYIENNIFDVTNFQRRDYVIESFSNDANGASVTAKDTLKMTNGDRAQAPVKSIGLLSADITDSDTSFTLTPAGVGDLKYPASGWVRLGDEVVSFTRSADVFTIVRAQYNTLADAHSLNDVAQLCLYYNDSLTDIIYDLITVYAGVPTGQINKTAWDNEADLYLPGLYEALITEPTGVDDLLLELGESAPHFMYWDERTNLINFSAIKGPPDTANVLTSEANILEGSTNIDDMPDMRISTVIVRFGQHDPTKDLDDTSNYRQTHVRITPDSITKYGGVQKFKTINSRWINNSNRAAGVRLAARYGRLFEEMPRKISFSLDAKDGELWTASPCLINSDLIVNDSLARYNMPAIILSAGESGTYNYTAIEHTYGAELADDLGTDDPDQRLVVLSGELTNINLRDVYDTLYPDADDSYSIVFVLDISSVIGSTSTSDYSLDTGSWPELTSSKITIDARNLVAGRGGDGGQNGGPAIILNTDIDLSNTGIIGGGAGGGGSANDSDGSDVCIAAGGGGAGYKNGLGGIGTFGKFGGEIQAANGTNLTGGAGGEAFSISGEATGGNGGNLGLSGNLGSPSSGAAGTAGAAINTNGYSITYLVTGDIRGAII